MSMDFGLVTAKEAASMTGLSSWTIYRWARMGLIPSIKLSRRRLFDLRELENFVHEHRQGGIACRREGDE
jgi:excisionase family DNA binding protein